MQRWASFRHYGWLNENFGEQQHGFAWHAALRVVLLCCGGALSPNAASLLVLTAGLATLFLGLRAWAAPRSDADSIALAGVAGVLLQPVWLRLAPTGTVLALSVAGQWATATSALWVARDPRPATVALCTALAVWTMQTHLEQLAVVPALVAAVLLAARSAPWRAYVRPTHVAIVALGALSLAPHLLVAARHDPLAMSRRPEMSGGHPYEVAWALRLLLVTGALTLLSVARRSEGALDASAGPTRSARLAAALTAVAAMCAHAAPALTLARGGETWSTQHMNRLTALADPSWGAPWLLGAALVGAAATWRARAFAVYAPLTALSLFIYADKFDTFSTWLRAALPVIAWLGPLSGVGVYAWGRALHARWGPMVAFAVTLALLAPWARPLTTPIDSQQEHDLLRAAFAEQRRGEVVHALTTRDRGALPRPDRLDWSYHRGHTEAWLTAEDRSPPPSLSDLLALSDDAARGRRVLLGPECFRLVTSSPTQAAGPTVTVAYGDRVFSGVSLQEPIDQTTDPRRRPTLSAWIPCAGDVAAQQCAERTEDGVCATWTCATQAASAPPGAASQPACEAVRRRFSLVPILEIELAPWSVNGSATDTLTDTALIGVYRVDGPR
jgi:hypothetical protein